MKKFNLLRLSLTITSLLALKFSGKTQAPIIEKQNITLGSKFNDVIKDKNGNYIAVGQLNIIPQFSWIVKYDKDLNLISYKLTHQYGNYTKIVESQNQDGYIVMGSISFTEENTNRYNISTFVEKLDADFNQKWEFHYAGKVYPNSATNEAPQALIKTTGGYLAAIQTSYPGFAASNTNHGGADDIFIIKFDENGKRLFSRYYGGASEEWDATLADDPTNNGFVLGCSSVSTDGDLSGKSRIVNDASKMWVAWINANDGTIYKSDVYGGSKYETISSIYRTLKGEWLLTGATNSTDGDFKNKRIPINSLESQAYILKLDKNGVLNPNYVKCFGSLSDIGMRVFESGYLNKIRMIGWKYNNPVGWVVQLNADFTTDYEGYYGNRNSNAMSGFKTSDYGTIFVGQTQGKGWIAKLTGEGNLYTYPKFYGSSKESSNSDLYAINNDITIYQNPGSKNSLIGFSVKKDGNTSVKVFNINGQEVATLFNGVAEKGKRYQAMFNGQNISSGIYIVKLQSGNDICTKKIFLTK